MGLREHLTACVEPRELERIRMVAGAATAIVQKGDGQWSARASLMMDVYGTGPTDISAIAQMRENLSVRSAHCFA